MLSPAIAHIVRFPEVAAVTTLMVVMVVALLLALHAHVRHYHLGPVPKAQCISPEVAAPERDRKFLFKIDSAYYCKLLPQSSYLSMSRVGLSRLSRDRLRLSLDRVMFGWSMVSFLRSGV